MDNFEIVVGLIMEIIEDMQEEVGNDSYSYQDLVDESYGGRNKVVRAMVNYLLRLDGHGFKIEWNDIPNSDKSYREALFEAKKRKNIL